MIRPFKSVAEFKAKTAIFVGEVISMRLKQDIFSQDLYLYDNLVTELNYNNGYVGIGTQRFSLKELCEKFEFKKDGKWLPFGVEETKKTAKFKVGEQYTGTNSNGEQFSVVISAKYRDPKDNKLRVVVSNRFLEVVYTDEDGNERFNLVGLVIKAEDKEDEIGF